MLKPIRNAETYEAAVKRLEELWACDENTPEADEFEILSLLIDAYEEKTFPVPPPSPVAAVLFALDQRNMKRSDLGKILGSAPRACEFLSGRRPLSLGNIRKLHAALKIPAEILIQPV